MVFWTPIITCMPLCSQEIYLISTFLNFITYRNVQPYYRRGFEHFWKVKKASSTISYSQSQNILRLVYRLAYSAVTNNETDIDYYHEKLNARVTSQVSKWRKTYNLRQWVHFYRITKLIVGLVSSLPSRNKNLALVLEKWTKAAVKLS